MKKKNQKIISLFLVFVVCISMSALALGHSGRTDKYGGHHDNKNVSGLGSYHYHHGYGPHLHPNGVCPYSGNSSSSNGNTSTHHTTAASTAKTLYQPDFGVHVNDCNLNMTDSNYYPVNMNSIVYIPLTTEMIEAMNLTGGWTQTDGLVLNSNATHTADSSNFTAGYHATVTTPSINKPTYRVVVNGTNLNVTDSQYYPVVMNDIVYVPLTSEAITALNLQGGWTENSGLVLKTL